MFPPFDPSKMDPKALMEMSRLIQQLPPEQLNKMQTLMHNMMAGFDVRREMEEFEKSLPPGFREKLMELVGSQMSAGAGAGAEPPSQSRIQGLGGGEEPAKSEEMNVREARLTILRAVAEGNVSPEEAERLLFRD